MLNPKPYQKTLEDWIKHKVKKEYDQVPPDVIDSAKRLDKLHLIAEQIGRRLCFKSDAVLDIIKEY